MRCGALGIKKQQGLQSLISHPRSAGEQEGKICLVAEFSGLCCSCEGGFTLWRHFPSPLNMQNLETETRFWQPAQRSPEQVPAHLTAGLLKACWPHQVHPDGIGAHGEGRVIKNAASDTNATGQLVLWRSSFS